MPEGLVTPGGRVFPRARAAVMYLSVGPTMNAGGTVPYDRVDFDTDGFADTTNHVFTIPTAMDGAYLFTHCLVVSDNAALTYVETSLGFGAEPFISSPFANRTGRVAGEAWSVVCSAVGQFVAGNSIAANAAWTGPVSVTVSATSGFSVAYLGPLT